MKVWRVIIPLTLLRYGLGTAAVMAGLRWPVLGAICAAFVWYYLADRIEVRVLRWWLGPPPEPAPTQEGP